MVLFSDQGRAGFFPLYIWSPCHQLSRPEMSKLDYHTLTKQISLCRAAPIPTFLHFTLPEKKQHFFVLESFYYLTWKYFSKNRIEHILDKRFWQTG